jgi:hypothetical protein
MPEIIELLYVPVLMQCQLFGPRYASFAEIVSNRCKIEFAPERSQPYVSITDGGLVLQNNIDLLRLVSKTNRLTCSQPVYNRSAAGKMILAVSVLICFQD